MPNAQTALVALVPAAESIVAPHRSRLDSGAGLGVPAHVTILFPFLPPDRVDAGVCDELTRLLGTHRAFDVAFDAVRWFGDHVAYLRPTPDEPFRRLTSSIRRRWPEYPPYAGTVDEPVPHLTIGDGGRTPQLEAAVEQIAEGLPVRAHIPQIHLMGGTDASGTWSELTVFPLG